MAAAFSASAWLEARGQAEVARLGDKNVKLFDVTPALLGGGATVAARFRRRRAPPAGGGGGSPASCDVRASVGAARKTAPSQNAATRWACTGARANSRSRVAAGGGVGLALLADVCIAAVNVHPVWQRAVLAGLRFHTDGSLLCFRARERGATLSTSRRTWRCCSRTFSPHHPVS